MRRSRGEIVAQILQHCITPELKSHIMVRAKLNLSLANTYLGALTAKGLLLKENSRFKVTDKGLEFLLSYNKIEKMLQIDNSRIEKKNVLSIYAMNSNFLRQRGSSMILVTPYREKTDLVFAKNGTE